jgi:hypothetical protein
MPARFRDELPPPPPLPPPPDIPDIQLDDEPITDQPLDEPERENEPLVADYHTEANSYGIYHVYEGGPPSYTPNELHTLQHVSDPSTFTSDPAANDNRPWWSSFGSSLNTINNTFFAPFLNATTFRLMTWFYNGSNLKSLGELDRLVREVLLADDFQVQDLHGFRAAREVERMDEWEDDPESAFSARDGWIETTVKISIPAEKVKNLSEADAPQYSVPGLFLQRPLEVIKAAFCERTAEHFHLSPFKTFWKSSPDSEPQRVISELYTSNAFIKEHENIKSTPRDDGCKLETVIAAIMTWSDSTHLTSFGNASLWPIYLFLGNLSKYTRGKPSAFAAHHLAYIPKVCMIKNS